MTVGELRRALFEYDDNALVAVFDVDGIKYIREPSIFMDDDGDESAPTLIIDLGE